jgi:CheY-like chemotaxis protein
MGKRVLVVDDDALIGRYIRDVLEQEGFSVTEALSGKDGLEAARNQRPDLILLDVMMPRMSGFQVCEALRRDVELQAIPVVMLTAMEDRKLNEQAFAAGAEVCMTKPFEPDRLVNVVKMALQGAARRRLLRQRGTVQNR